MNITINELRKKAWSYASTTVSDNPQLRLFEEEFSRLIITHCRDICNTLSDDYLSAAKMQGINNESQSKALHIASSYINILMV